MKKVFLALALVATVVTSCNKVTAPTPLTTTDSTAVQVDSVSVDSASLEVTKVDTITPKC